MTSSENQPLPLDPGPVPASLRDAFTLAEELRRGASPLPHPDDTATDLLLETSGNEQVRLSVIEQLLASHQGVHTLAHLVAARSAGIETVGDTGTPPTPSSGVLHLGVVNPVAVRRRRVNAALKPILLAASLMMVAGSSWYVFTLPPERDEVRALGVAVELHAVGQASAAAPITLAWRALRTTSRYRVEVLDVGDDPVFSTETNDTTAVVPPGSLAPGTYRWWVRSRGTDGTEIRSRVEKLVVR